MTEPALDRVALRKEIRALLERFHAAGTEAEQRAAMRRIYTAAGEALGLPVEQPPED